MNALPEDFFYSLKAIVDVIRRSPNVNERNIAFDDFVSKLDHVKRSSLNKTAESKVDLIVFTIIPKEQEALARVFQFDLAKEPQDINGIRFWKITFENFENKAFSIVFARIGDVGNVSTAIACTRFFRRFQPELAVLVGIAAGLKGKVGMYSTVCGTSVASYEFQRLETKVVKPRPFIYNNNPLVNRYLRMISDNIEGWKSMVKQKVDDLPSDSIDGENFYNDFYKNIDINFGPIASGEKLFADGHSLKDLNKTITLEKGVIAADMESAGFCQACEEFQIPHIVLRGISDFGGVEKDKTKNKKNQIIAALSAGSTLREFLYYYYKPLKTIENQVF